MCELASRLLAEKLIDDFYEEDGRQEPGEAEALEDSLTEALKSRLSMDDHALLFRWEAQCTETCGAELRRFARFVADMMLDGMDCKVELPTECVAGR
ncbi:hypothetical protein [Alicyclobacillus sp. ALC3]|uniref:hypothetical protein n=1 Tax=Alicyclobacillus sp. ALC3 TaxID=2796143 RepID=UPI00237983E6|nr:hypothetical protein [Alicyclobacillus sp. ALC3]WDL96674.1 hypothetical protein JC200_20585 [Alicyclobacillus sp. ALC3]